MTQLKTSSAELAEPVLASKQRAEAGIYKHSGRQYIV